MGLESNRKPSIPSLWMDAPPSSQMVTVEVDGPAVAEGSAPFELARNLDSGVRLSITERRHLLDDARSLRPASRLIRRRDLQVRIAAAVRLAAGRRGCSLRHLPRGRSPQAYRAARRVSGAVSSGAKTCSTTIRARR